MNTLYSIGKRIALSITFVLSAFISQCQPVLIGMAQTGGGSAANGGSIFQVNVALDSIILIDTFTTQINTPKNMTLTAAPDGSYFGVTMFGGTYGHGAIVKYDPYSNSYTLSASFNYPVGVLPSGELILANNGLYYGLAFGGGTYDGTLYSFDPIANTITDLADLGDYAQPIGSLIQASDGYLYGVTQGGFAGYQATIFRYDITTDSFTIMYLFAEGSDAIGTLIEVGADTLYGLSISDSSNTSSFIYRFIPATDSVMVLCNLPTGATSSGSLLRSSDGMLYGVTNFDGLYSGGTIFRYGLQTGHFDIVHNFAMSATDGGYPHGSLYQASDGYLYGCTDTGGLYSLGTIFRYGISDSSYATVASFSLMTGWLPFYGHLTGLIPVSHYISQQPASDTVCMTSGSTVSFTAADSSSLPACVHWQVSTDGGHTYSFIPGAVHTTLTMAVADSMAGYKYRAVFSDGDTSQPAVLSKSVNAYFSLFPTDTPHQWYAVNQCSGEPPLSYTWSWGDGSPNSTGDTPSHAFEEAGYYTICVTVTDANGCSASYCDSSTYLFKDQSSQMIYVDVRQYASGIAPVSSYHFGLRPNPAQGSIEVMQDYPGTVSAYITDLTGQEAGHYQLAGAQTGIDISGLAPGMYMVQLIGAEGQVLAALRFIRM